MGSDLHLFGRGIQARHRLVVLLERGAAGIHFYVLNKSQAASAVLEAVPLPQRI